MTEHQKYTIRALRPGIPQAMGFLLLAGVALLLQFAHPVYMTVMGDVVGANQFYREDISFIFQVSMVSMTMMFPILWKVRGAFTSYAILLCCLLVVAACLVVCAYAGSLEIMLVAAFIMGMFKMMGTFEALSSIMLIVTPKANFKVWFTVLYCFILACVQLSGILAVYFTDFYEWQFIYMFMVMAILFVALLVVVGFRAVPPMPAKPLGPLDWKGFLLWTSLFLLIIYVAIYGQVEDWFSSHAIVLTTFSIPVVVGLLLLHYRTQADHYVPAPCLRYSNVLLSALIIFVLQFFLNTGGNVLSPFMSAIMQLDSINSVNLNVYIFFGLLAGLAFSLYWFEVRKGGFTMLFFIGFLTLACYHLLVYRNFSTSAGADMLYFPYFLRGMGNIIIYAAVAVYMMRGVPFPMFAGALFVVAVARNAIGGTISSSIISNFQHHRMVENLQKLALRVDENQAQASSLYQGVKGNLLHHGASYLSAESAAAGTLYGRVYRQALLLTGSEIFGLVAFLGVVIVVLLLLYALFKMIKRRPVAAVTNNG